MMSTITHVHMPRALLTIKTFLFWMNVRITQNNRNIQIVALIAIIISSKKSIEHGTFGKTLKMFIKYDARSRVRAYKYFLIQSLIVSDHACFVLRLCFYLLTLSSKSTTVQHFRQKALQYSHFVKKHYNIVKSTKIFIAKITQKNMKE